jgi:hypothetical protein
MARLGATIVVTFAWWLRPYLFGVMTMVHLTGCEPDYDKVEKTIRRAVRMRLI